MLDRCCACVSAQVTPTRSSKKLEVCSVDVQTDPYLISSPCLHASSSRVLPVFLPVLFSQRARRRFSPDMVRWSAGNAEMVQKSSHCECPISFSLELLVWMKTTGSEVSERGVKPVHIEIRRCSRRPVSQMSHELRINPGIRK